MEEVEHLAPRRRKRVRKVRETLELMAERVRQVVKQTKARIFQGITHFPGKIVSVFEPHTEIIRKGKASKPTEFGKLVQVRSEEHTSELQSQSNLVCRLLLEKKKTSSNAPSLRICCT